MKTIENINLYMQLFVGVILLGSLGLVSNYYFQIRSIERNALFHIPKYEKRFDEYANSEAKKIASYLELIKDRKELQDLFKSGDREKLYEAAKPIFDHLNANDDVTHFYFIKPSAEAFLRVHDKDKHSDVINRYSFLKAKETLAPFHGLEFGLKKNYTLRVVQPWIVDGELLGYLELGKEVDKVIDSLSHELGIEIYFAINKSVIDDSPEFVRRRLKDVHKTHSQYVAYKTAAIPKNFDSLMNGEDEFSWVSLGEQTYISHKNVLKDVSGDNLGFTLYLVNVTQQYAQFTSALSRYGAIMAIATFLTLEIGFLFARKSRRKINATLINLEQAKQKAESLLNEQKNLLSLFDKGDSILFKWNNDELWSIEYVSDNVDKLFGYEKEEFLNNEVVYASCVHKDDIAHVEEEVGDVIENNLDFLKHDPYRVLTKSGEVKWIIDYTVTQKDASGAIKYFIGYIIDITQQKNKDKLQKFVDTQNSIVVLTDGKTLKFANKTFLEFFGYEDLERFKERYNCICERFVEHGNFFHLGKVKENEENWIESLLNLSGRQRVVSMLNEESSAHAFSVSINSYEKDDYVVTFTDVSDSMVEKLELTKEATIDALTGLYNRVYFAKYVNKILEKRHSRNVGSGVIFFDIDHFKKVNDAYGHDVGDYVLNKVASLVKKHTRAHDKIIRWGGEEFIIICETNQKSALKEMSEHLREAIEDYHFKDVGALTCSFGCALHDERRKILDTIKEADEKLYVAKNSGRNRVEC